MAKERQLEDYRCDDLMLNAGYYEAYGAGIIIELIGKGIDNEVAVNRQLGADFRDQTRMLKQAAEHIAMARKIMSRFDFIIPRLFSANEDMVADMELLHGDANEITAIMLMYLYATTCDVRRSKICFDSLKKMIGGRISDDTKTIINYFLSRTNIGERL